MTAEWPVPERDALDPFRGGQAQYIKDRDVFVPPFYVEHENAGRDITVKQDGVPLLPLRTVYEVAPERRWAIAPDGELLYEALYLKLLEQNWEFCYTLRKQPVPADHKFSREPQPCVREYTNWTVDTYDESRLQPIGYDRDATKGAVPQQLFDGNEESKDRLAALCEAYADPRAREKMRPDEIAEVESHLGVSGPSLTGIAAKLEMLDELLADGSLTPEVHSQQVAALTGTVIALPPAPTMAEPKPVRKAAKSTMPCGEEVWNMHSKRHKSSCERCQELGESAA